MFNAVYLISLAEASDRESVCTRLAEALPADCRSLIAPTLEGGYNGGDIIVRLRLADETQWEAVDAALMQVLNDPSVRHVDSAAYQDGKGREAEPDLSDGVYRALLLSVDRPVNNAVIGAFEEEMLQMPDYIPAIRNARLARVHHARGRMRWTHVWEQEYSDISGLMGPYMMHPYHWGHIDRWFDPECADWMINTHICHSFCPLDQSIIHSGQPR